MFYSSSCFRTLLTIALFFCLPSDSFGQAASPSETLTLEQAVAAALRENRKAQNALLEIEKTEDQLAAFRTKRLPVFNLNVLVSQQIKELDFTFTKGVFGTFPGIGPVPATDTALRTPLKPTAIIIGQIQQPLSQQYQIGLGLRQLKLSRQAAQEQLRARLQSAVNDVKRAYYGILQTQSAMQSIEEAIVLYRELDRVTGDFVLQQVALKSENLEAKTRLEKAEYERLNLTNTNRRCSPSGRQEPILKKRSVMTDET